MKMRKAVAIESCLLVLLIVGATNPKYIAKHKNLYPVYNERHFAPLLGLLRLASSVVCTAHILTETSNLLRQVADPMRTEIMNVFRKFVHQSRELQADSVVASNAPTFIRLGLTDAAIVSLDPDEVAVITVDHDLHIAASQAGFEVSNLTPYFHESR
jgi:hypothetical protein